MDLGYPAVPSGHVQSSIREKTGDLSVLNEDRALDCLSLMRFLGLNGCLDRVVMSYLKLVQVLYVYWLKIKSCPQWSLSKWSLVSLEIVISQLCMFGDGECLAIGLVVVVRWFGL